MPQNDCVLPLPIDSLFYDEDPLIVNPTMAEKIGLNQTIILHQVKYWQNINKKAGKNYIDGYYWTYNTYEEWNQQFPWWSVGTIKRVVQELERIGVLISSNYNKSKIDKTKWYRVNFEHQLLRRVPSMGAKCAIDGINLDQAIPETKAETTTNIDTDASNETAPPLAKKTRAKKASPSIPDDHQAVLNYVTTIQGRIPFINPAAQEKFLVSLLDRGITLEQVKALADYMWSTDFWKGRNGFTIGNILYNADRYLGNISEKTQPHTPPSDLPPDQYDLIPERFPGEKKVLQQLKERGFVWNTLTGKYEKPS